MSTNIFFSKSIVFRKLVSNNILSLDHLYDILDNSENIEDLKKKQEDRLIVGTIKKSYNYDAKRYIEDQNVSGKQEYKFFKFVIKEELTGYFIACHYEGQFGAFSVLRDILQTEIKPLEIFLLYKKYKDIKYSDLKKIEHKSTKYEKKPTPWGIFKQKKEEVRELKIQDSSNEEISKEKLYTLLSIKDDGDEDEEIVALYVTLKNGRKINILDTKNTHFPMGNIEYVNNLPREDKFISKVSEIITKEL